MKFWNSGFHDINTALCPWRAPTKAHQNNPHPKYISAPFGGPRRKKSSPLLVLQQLSILILLRFILARAAERWPSLAEPSCLQSMSAIMWLSSCISLKPRHTTAPTIKHPMAPDETTTWRNWLSSHLRPKRGIGEGSRSWYGLNIPDRAV